MNFHQRRRRARLPAQPARQVGEAVLHDAVRDRVPQPVEQPHRLDLRRRRAGLRRLIPRPIISRGIAVVAQEGAARGRWLAYKEAGHGLTYWQQTDGGGWGEKE